jgi:hypothetical protein
MRLAEPAAGTTAPQRGRGFFALFSSLENNPAMAVASCSYCPNPTTGAEKTQEEPSEGISFLHCVKECDNM